MLLRVQCYGNIVQVLSDRRHRCRDISLKAWNWLWHPQRPFSRSSILKTEALIGGFPTSVFIACQDWVITRQETACPLQQGGKWLVKRRAGHLTFTKETGHLHPVADCHFRAIFEVDDRYRLRCWRPYLGFKTVDVSSLWVRITCKWRNWSRKFDEKATACSASRSISCV